MISAALSQAPHVRGVPLYHSYPIETHCFSGADIATMLCLGPSLVISPIETGTTGYHAEGRCHHWVEPEGERLLRAGNGRLLAKAEFLRPGGSVKGRAARAVLLAARAGGRLQSSAPVVEMTSGNMTQVLRWCARCWVIRSSSPCRPGTVHSGRGCWKPWGLRWSRCRKRMVRPAK
jgi:hypothetical protein